MEVFKQEYMVWRTDFDRMQYYRKRNLRHGFLLVSLSDSSSDTSEKGLTIEEVTGCDTPGTWELAIEEMEVKELLQAISKLSQRDRELLKMRFWDSMTQQEMAEVVGTSIPGIHKRLKRPYAKFGQLMSIKRPLFQCETVQRKM